jgi:hypothetical protein
MDSLFTSIGIALVGLGALTAVVSALPLEKHWPAPWYPAAFKALGGTLVFEGIMSFLLALSTMQRSVPFPFAATLIGLLALILVLLLMRQLRLLRTPAAGDR